MIFSSSPKDTTTSEVAMCSILFGEVALASSVALHGAKNGARQDKRGLLPAHLFSPLRGVISG